MAVYWHDYAKRSHRGSRRRRRVGRALRLPETHVVRSEPGTYALLLQSNLTDEIGVGRWRSLRIELGYYLYVGSAFGPGGVRARVTRHFRRQKRNHWHIDYLREAIEPVCAWFSYEPLRLEHRWARALAQRRDITCIKGFGCSDCGCASHLFAMSTMPDCAELSSALGSSLASYEPADDNASPSSASKFQVDDGARADRCAS